MAVFDSSALIAWLRSERGALEVRRLLRANRGGCVAHAVNLMEVFIHFARWNDEPTAERALQIIARAGVTEREDLDTALRRDAVRLVVNARRRSQSLALGDSLGLALARRLDCEFVTADHGELATIAAQGLCQVRFIR
jgi:PIN domain nuclease of toxin-antitoxin system